jgi:hypothetical protein
MRKAPTLAESFCNRREIVMPVGAFAEERLSENTPSTKTTNKGSVAETTYRPTREASTDADPPSAIANPPFAIRSTLVYFHASRRGVGKSTFDQMAAASLTSFCMEAGSFVLCEFAAASAAIVQL